MRALSISLHTVAVLAMGLAFQALISTPAGASTLAACLTSGGDFKHVAIGKNPSKPCGRNDTVIVWDLVPDPVDACPVINASMVDAAALVAFDVTASVELDPSAVTATLDDPAPESILCEIITTSGEFFVRVNSEIGNAAVRADNDGNGIDDFSTKVENVKFLDDLSAGQVSACREEVQKTLVWRTLCAPALQP